MAPSSSFGTCYRTPSRFFYSRVDKDLGRTGGNLASLSLSFSGSRVDEKAVIVINSFLSG